MAARRPRIRLTSVDLPTFGRPTTATRGSRPVGSSSCWPTVVSLCLLITLTTCRLIDRGTAGDGQKGLEALTEELAGRPATGAVTGRLGQVDRRADHDPDRGREREPAEAAPDPRGAEDRHRQDRAALPDHDIGQSWVDGREPPVSPGALG